MWSLEFTGKEIKMTYRPPDPTFSLGNKILKIRAQNKYMSIKFSNQGLSKAANIVVILKQSNNCDRNCILDFPVEKIVKR